MASTPATRTPTPIAPADTYDPPGWRCRWDAYAERLREVAAVPDGSGPGANAHWRQAKAAAVLRELDDLTVEALVELEDRVWLEVGRALVDTGHDRLWAALYALTTRARDQTYRSGDEVRFLARYRDVALLARPPEWPWPWLAPRGPEP